VAITNQGRPEWIVVLDAADLPGPQAMAGTRLSSLTHRPFVPRNGFVAGVGINILPGPRCPGVQKINVIFSRAKLPRLVISRPTPGIELDD